MESGNIFGAGTPGGTTSEDAAYELGTQFQSTVNATITALRVWCPTGGPSNYTAHLWNAGGALLATVTIPATANAWAQANLNPTVNITAYHLRDLVRGGRRTGVSDQRRSPGEPDYQTVISPPSPAVACTVTTEGRSPRPDL